MQYGLHFSLWQTGSGVWLAPVWRSADFQVCRVAGFQTRWPHGRGADLEVGDTEGLETCPTQHRLLPAKLILPPMFLHDKEAGRLFHSSTFLAGSARARNGRRWSRPWPRSGKNPNEEHSPLG